MPGLNNLLVVTSLVLPLGMVTACTGSSGESESSSGFTATEATTGDPTGAGPSSTGTTGGGETDTTATATATEGPTTGDPTTGTTTTGTTTTAGSTESDTTEGTTGGPPDGHYFPDGAPWYEDISEWPLAPDSEAVTGWLDGVGWGLGKMQIDFSIEVLTADENTQFRSFEPNGGFYVPDCDLVDVPVPDDGALEGEQGYACEGDGDCHLIVVHGPSQKLYEMWRANIVGDAFDGGCLAVWDMTRVYGPTGRGEQCTSADAAGYPIAPLLFTADEVAAGTIDHAIRFILPNSSIRDGEYVHPATHGTPAASGPAEAPPYGARLRLRADFPLDSLPNDGARTVAKAMQTYGILLADGGNVALTAQSDRFTESKWAGVLGPHDLNLIQPGDFEMVDGGAPIELTLDCVREPL